MLLVLRTGDAIPDVAAHRGEFFRWIQEGIGDAWDGAWEEHDARVAEPLPISGARLGIVVTGSSHSVTERAPWMLRAEAWLREAVGSGVPVFGICFGHQLLAYAFGGRVHAHPRGWEVGTCEVRVRSEGESDPLFSSLPTRIRANMSHRDEVVDLPPTIRCLAENDHSSAQAIAVGDGTRGVQFHPEISGETLRHILAFRRQRLIEECGHCARAIDVDALIGASSDTPEAEEVLRNFIRHFVDRA